MEKLRPFNLLSFSHSRNSWILWLYAPHFLSGPRWHWSECAKTLTFSLSIYFSSRNRPLKFQSLFNCFAFSKSLFWKLFCLFLTFLMQLTCLLAVLTRVLRVCLLTLFFFKVSLLDKSAAFSSYLAERIRAWFWISRQVFLKVITLSLFVLSYLIRPSKKSLKLSVKVMRCYHVTNITSISLFIEHSHESFDLVTVWIENLRLVPKTWLLFSRNLSLIECLCLSELWSVDYGSILNFEWLYNELETRGRDLVSLFLKFSCIDKIALLCLA